ncbi:ISL3 family transposase [Bdellovibrio sp. BCCA]|uniref:ISL3 family transposase n=1 Tax=Bdellovibrio sp. BCCA TaxID=3136281 RepID=UPI0030F21C56
MPHYDPIIGLNDIKINKSLEHGAVELNVDFVGEHRCPFCSSNNLRKKDTFIRRLKHLSIGTNQSILIIKTFKFQCRACKRYFNQRIPGVKPRFQCTEVFREEAALKHHWGFSRAMTAKLLGISPATVERCYKHHLKMKDSHRKNGSCPKVLGIDEKHFTRSKGYMTTLADLKRHKVYDVTLGRSELSLNAYLRRLPDKKNCRVIVMDLSETYRSIAKKHFSHAMIVADRFHVVKLINHHFLKTWSELDEAGRKNRGLLSLMRRHRKNLSPEQEAKLRKYLKQNPALEVIYDFKQTLMNVILARVTSKDQASHLIPDLLEGIKMLKECGFKYMKILGETLESWQEEIVRMWRFSKTNSITEGLHNRMEEIIRRAYGFRNFENFRLRVLEYCS